VLHKCDNRLCVNPEHLFLGTNAVNMADKCAKGRQTKGEQHGPAKLTEAAVLAIRSDPRLLRVIAAEYNVQRQTVGKIKNRKLWAHLP
jgi:hypothetical protein